jgi:hypothetical protein
VRVIKFRRLRRRAWSQNRRREYFQNVNKQPYRKETLGKPRRRKEDNIRMDLIEIGVNTRNWADSAHNRDYWRAL